MLVITGSGRCGTSVLARFCHNMGYATGGSWNHEVNAGMEDSKFVETNEAIHRGEISENVKTYTDRFSKLVVKDPRFMRASVVKYWAKRRPDLRLIVCVRDMESVIASFSDSKFNDGDHLAWVTNRTHEMMLAYVEIGRHQVPVRFLAFPSFLDEYKTVYDLLNWAGLSIDYNRGEIAWNGLVDKDMVHYK